MARRKLKPPEKASNNHDVIAIDNHGFALRMRRTIDGTWVRHTGRRVPILDDRDIAGWIEMPELPEGVK